LGAREKKARSRHGPGDVCLVQCRVGAPAVPDSTHAAKPALEHGAFVISDLIVALFISMILTPPAQFLALGHAA
jgi:hypothetical protein